MSTTDSRHGAPAGLRLEPDAGRGISTNGRRGRGAAARASVREARNGELATGAKVVEVSPEAAAVREADPSAVTALVPFTGAETAVLESTVVELEHRRPMIDRLETRADAQQSIVYRVSMLLSDGEPLPRFVCSAEELFDYERFQLACFKAIGFVFSSPSAEEAAGELELRRAWRSELGRLLATRCEPWKDEFPTLAVGACSADEIVARGIDSILVAVPDGGTLKSMLNLVEREIIGHYLRASGGVSAAARSLGVSRQQLQYRMNRLGVRGREV